MPQQVECPKCNKPVSVGDNAAGKRVKCPHCEKAFLAPGFAVAANDDDDWLALDNDPPASAPVVQAPAQPTFEPPAEPASSPAKPKGESSRKPKSSGRREKSSGGKKTTPPKPSLPKTHVNTEPLDVFGDLPPVDDAPDAEDDLPARSLETEPAGGFSQFGAALDEFTAEVEPLPGTEPSDDLFGDLPPVDSVAPAAPAPEFPSGDLPDADALPGVDLAPVPSAPVSTPPRAELEEYATEYRVKCKICGTLLYAKASQQGKNIRCSDCHSNVKVPPPPKVKKKTKINVENAETFTFEDAPERSTRQDPYRKSAEELLDEAARVETTEPVSYTDNPDMKQWAKDIFGIFLDPGVLSRWIGLSTLGAIPTYIALWSESQILYMGLMIGGAIFAAMVVIYGFAIMQSVANQRDSVSDWPEADPGAWADDLLFAIAAAALAGGPIWLLTTVLGGASVLGFAATLLSIFALFPFIILSMLDMRSIFVPFSPEVARSVSKSQESWGALYLSSGLLFFALFMFVAGLFSAATAPGAAIAVFAGVGVAFCYFGMLGRLAYQIGQDVNEPAKAQGTESTNVGEPST